MERDRTWKDFDFTLNISTHTLTWSVTGKIIQWICNWYNFNSHAHVERDDVDNYVRKLIDNFNSHAHVERDISKIILGWHILDFNSHAHVERD